MNDTSKKFLIVQMILMGVFTLPPLMGLFIPGEPSTAPFIINLLKDGGILMTGIVVNSVFSLVSIVASFFNLGKDSVSPIKISLINQAVSIVWVVITFLLWVQWLGSPYSIFNSDATGEEAFGLAIVAILLATLMVAMLLPSLVITVIPANFHAIMYAFRCFNTGKYGQKALPIIGVIFLFLLPFVGQILLLIYESQLKDIIENE